ncbi:MAG: 2,3-bisphosphoglycerate-dependent phosphoglycerate mutase, partial [Rhodomicrobium sp.]
MDNVLVLVRHGQSEWNKLNLFTGWRDPDPTETGVEEARRAGKLIKKERIVFDIAFTSGLKRAQHTLEMILGELGQQDLETIKDQAINERHYGDLCGLNKDDARKKCGEEQVHIWRRSYDVSPPGGESLKDTA